MWVHLESFAEGAYVVGKVLGDRLALKVPDYGAQLVVDVERETLVDAPDATVGVVEAVTALAVCIVGQPVKHGDTLHLLDVSVLEGEVVLRRVVLDEELEHAVAHFEAVAADDGGRDEMPADGLADNESGVLALEERAVG